jgi:hypothetical protein
MAAAAADGVQLERELVGGPQVVVIKKGDPGAVGLGDSPVTSCADPLRDWVAHDPHSRIGRTGNPRRGVVCGAIVDDDDLEVDLALIERAM